MEKFREIVHEAITQWSMPGISVAVGRADEIVWSEGFGLAEVENAVPATSETVYRLASITKPITATAVMQLVERGKVDLEAPIQQYVPEFPEKPWPITVRLVLSHLGGIRDFTEAESWNYGHYPYGVKMSPTFLDRFKNEPLQYEPNTRFRYSTHGYNLLGYVIENAAETDYLSYIREHIFGPAGIEHIQADDVQAIIPHRARGYTRAEDGALRHAAFTDTSDHLPGGGLCGTAEDVVRFGMALQGGKLLGPEALAKMLTRQRTREGRDIRFGLGWFMSTRNGETEIAHGGKHHGTSTMLHVRLDSGIVVGILTNLQEVSSPFMYGLAQRLGDVL